MSSANNEFRLGPRKVAISIALTFFFVFSGISLLGAPLIHTAYALSPTVYQVSGTVGYSICVANGADWNPMNNACSIPELVYWMVSSPVSLSVDKGYILLVGSGGRLEVNGGTVNNYGTIETYSSILNYNSGTMNNYATINVENQGSISNGGGTINNYKGATINNYYLGTISDRNYGTIYNYGTITTNVGTIDNTNGQIYEGCGATFVSPVGPDGTFSGNAVVDDCSLSISPTQGPTGTFVGLSGGGYNPPTLYYICYEADTSSATACSPTFSFTPDATGNIPSGLLTPLVGASGSSNGLVVVSDSTSGNVVTSAEFMITVPTISLNPAAGTVGTNIAVTGSGFSVHMAISLFTFGGATPATQTCTAQTTSAIGTFSCTFTVPPSSGANTVTASGYDANQFYFQVPADSASATFSFPSLTITPGQGPTGSTISLSGNGYSPSSTYNYCYEADTSTATACSSTDQFIADTSGSIPAVTLTAATGSTNGLVVVSDPNTDAVITTTAFSITTPTIVLVPSSGGVGSSVTVTGSGFSIDMPINIFTYAGTTPATQTCTAQTTDSTGAFSCTFTVPPSSGTNTVTASGYDATQFYFAVPSDTASTTFKVLVSTSTSVDCSATSIDISSAPTTCTATVTGASGSIDGEQITWSQSGTGSVTLSSSSCNLSGGSCFVTVTGATAGGVTLAASYGEDTTNAGSSGTFTLSVNAALSSVTLGSFTTNPVYISSLDGVTVSWSGGTSPYAVNLYYSTSSSSCSSSDTLAATASGVSTTSNSITFTTPSSPGDYYYCSTLTDSVGGSGSSSSSLLTVKSPTYSVRFDQSGIPTSGVSWGVTVGSTDYTGTGSSITVSGLSGTLSYSYDYPVSGSVGTRYVCSSECSGSVSGSATESASYTTQYLLTVTANPSSLSSSISPTSSSKYYDSGIIVTLTANPSNGYVFVVWNLDGTNQSLLASSLTVTMDSPQSATAIYEAPAGGVQSLANTVNSLNIAHGTQASLDAKLNAALSSLNQGNSNAAVNQLNAFINAVRAQNGKHLTTQQAELFTSYAQDILNTIND